jgi:penicillin-binding protein 1A
MTKKTYSSEEMDRYFNDPSYRRSFLGRGKGFLKRNWKIALGLVVIIVGLLFWYGTYIAGGLPSLEELENPKPALASKVYAEDGAVLDQFAEQNRTRIELAKLPQGLIDALIATEDKDFYTHWGVNLNRFARQMVINLLTFRQYGASTITQQLARNLYKLQGRDESMFDKITRKIREFFTSFRLNATLPRARSLSSI